MLSLDDLGTLYKENQSEEMLTEIFTLSIAEAKKIIKTNKNLSYLQLPEGFCTEVALELVSKIKSGGCDKNITTILNNICVTNSNKYNSIKIIKYFEEKNPDYKIDSKLYLEDIIKNINQYPINIKIVVLYCLCFDDIKLLPKLQKFFTDLKFSILVGATIDIKNKIDNSPYDFDKHIPSTPIGRTILILKLMEKYPELSVFLMLLKDFKKFLQFIIINQDRNFKVPPINNITSDIINISKTINNIENADISEEDMCSINEILFSDISLVANLSQFIDKIMNDTLELYKKLCDKIIGNKDKYSEEEIKSIYEYLTTRLKSETNIHKSIFLTSEKFIKTKMEEAKDA